MISCLFLLLLKLNYVAAYIKGAWLFQRSLPKGMILNPLEVVSRILIGRDDVISSLIILPEYTGQGSVLKVCTT